MRRSALWLVGAVWAATAPLALAQDEEEATFPEPPREAEQLIDFLPAKLRDLRPPSVPDEGEGLPDPYEPEAGATHAVFLRLVEATLGGNFDSAGAEEVVVFFDCELGDRLRLARHVLDLPKSTVQAFDVRAGSPYVELPDRTLALSFEVLEEDVTEWEDMTGSQDDLALDPAGLTGEPRRIGVPLETIRGQAWGLFSGSSPIKLKGASLALEAVRVERRDAPDDGARAVVGQVLDAIPAELPTDLQARVQLCEALLRAAEQGAAAVRESTHTWLRAELGEQVALTRRLAAYARGALGADPRVQAAVYEGHAEGLARVEVEGEAVVAARAALIEALRAGDGAAIEARADALEAALDEQDGEAAFELQGELAAARQAREGLAACVTCQALLARHLPLLRGELASLAGR